MGVVNARRNVEESIDETPLVASAVYPPRQISSCSLLILVAASLTKQTNQSKINQDSVATISSARPHQNDNQRHRNGKVYLKLKCGNGFDDVGWIELGLLLLCAEDDSDDSKYGNDDTPKVSHAKTFFEHNGCDDAVGD